MIKYMVMFDLLIYSIMQVYSKNIANYTKVTQFGKKS